VSVKPWIVVAHFPWKIGKNPYADKYQKDR
jgi:hypothetical protein